jgi:hypothetical protein
LRLCRAKSFVVYNPIRVHPAHLCLKTYLKAFRLLGFPFPVVPR